MSRTDVHRPWWVLQNDPAWRHEFIDRHDHRDGVCNLHEWLAARDGWLNGCYREYRGIRRLCACELCAFPSGRRLSHRRMRVRWRNAARAVLTTPDVEEIALPDTRVKRLL